MSQVLYVDKSNYEKEVTQSDLPVLIDFYATWCAPCKMIAPVVEKVAEEQAAKMKVVKIDTDQSPEIAMNFRLPGIPTLVLLKQGQEAFRNSGVLNYGQLTGMLGPHL